MAQDKKKAKRRRAVIVFVDERASATNRVRPALPAPRMQPPVLRSKCQWRQISTMAPLAMNGRIYKCHYREATRKPQAVRVLRHLRSCPGGPLIVIWYQSQAHGARVVKEYLATEQEISVEWLPSYGPELNPEEYCQGNVKEQIRNTTLESVEEMQR